MLEKQKLNLEKFTDKTVSLAEKTVLPHIDAYTVLANLCNATEIADAQASLEELKSAMTRGDKAKLIEMLSVHSALLSALSVRLLSDANSCKSEKLTISILELALKSFDCTRRTVTATNDLISAPVPLIALQVNNSLSDYVARS
jgi:hypothetical protein